MTITTFHQNLYTRGNARGSGKCYSYMAVGSSTTCLPLFPSSWTSSQRLCCVLAECATFFLFLVCTDVRILHRTYWNVAYRIHIYHQVETLSTYMFHNKWIISMGGVALNRNNQMSYARWWINPFNLFFNLKRNNLMRILISLTHICLKAL